MKIVYGQELVTELRMLSDKVTDRLWIAVPYLGGFKTVHRILGKCWLQNPRLSVRLLTDVDELSNLSSETIKRFHEVGQIKHLAGIHAKIFIFDNVCLITSANLTNTAFTKRHEIGIFLDEANSTRSIEIFEAWWEKSRPVSTHIMNTFHKGNL